MKEFLPSLATLMIAFGVVKILWALVLKLLEKEKWRQLIFNHWLQRHSHIRSLKIECVASPIDML